MKIWQQLDCKHELCEGKGVEWQRKIESKRKKTYEYMGLVLVGLKKY